MVSRRERRSAAQWRELIDQQAVSGLSAKAFCDRKAIVYASFIHWRRRLGEALPARASASRRLPEFVELTPPADDEGEARRWIVELDLGAGVRLRIAQPQ